MQWLTIKANTHRQSIDIATLASMRPHQLSSGMQIWLTASRLLPLPNSATLRATRPIQLGDESVTFAGVRYPLLAIALYARCSRQAGRLIR